MRTLTNFLIFTFIVCTSNTRAQSNENCNQNLSIFAESAKVKNYEAAYEPWMAVRNECPSLNVAIYTYGERILKSRFKKAEGEAKQTEAQDLMKLYDQWIQYFPTKKGKSRIGSILSSKAQTMIDNNLGTPAEIYATFDHAFTQDITSFTNPKGLYNYFKTMLNLHKEGSTDFTPEKLFNKYEEVSEKFEFERVKLAKKLDVLLKKEENGIPLTTKDLKRKKVYDTNSRAIGIFVSNLDIIAVVPIKYVPAGKYNARLISTFNSRQNNSFNARLIAAVSSVDPSPTAPKSNTLTALLGQLARARVFVRVIVRCN